MTVPFSKIPSNLRTPFFHAEFDNSQANTATTTQRTLIIGQQLDASSAEVNKPVLYASASTVSGVFGAGSMLHSLMEAYLANDISAEIYLLPLADDADSMTPATGKITVASTPAKTGVISLYIAGIRVQLTVTPYDTTALIASALASAINAKSSLPVKASAANAVITLTAKNKGAHGNGIDIRLNYLGSAGGEETPNSLTLTIAAMSGGAGSPILDDACQYRSNSDPPCQSKTDPPPMIYSRTSAFDFFWIWPLFSLSFSR